MFLLPEDQIMVFRFTRGVTEHESWKESAGGWIYNIINNRPDFDEVCQNAEARRTSKGYAATWEQANEIAKRYGGELGRLPDDRPIAILRKEEAIIFQVKGTEQIDGWDLPTAIARHLEYVINLPEEELNQASDLVRVFIDSGQHVVATGIESIENDFLFSGKSDIIAGLQSSGMPRTMAEERYGAAVRDPWRLKNEPFQEEWDFKNKIWNDGAQLAYEPTPGEHPHHDFLFSHIGKYLDDYLEDIDYCRQHGIDGKRYLMLWNASLLRQPSQSLPLLFLWSSEENKCGKSTFLMTLMNQFKESSPGSTVRKGVADAYLTLKEKYNKKFHSAVLCYIEEKSLCADEWYDIKDRISAPTQNIRMMRTDSFDAPNYTHFVVTSNKADSLAIPKGSDESRVVMIRVNPIEKDLRDEFEKKNKLGLARETPHWLHTLMNMDLPPTGDRLYLPVPMTTLKADVLEVNMLVTRKNLREFVDECCVVSQNAQCEQVGLKEAWISWCKTKKLDAKTTNVGQLAKALVDAGFDVANKRPSNGNRARMFSGIRLKDSGTSPMPRPYGIHDASPSPDTSPS